MRTVGIIGTGKMGSTLAISIAKTKNAKMIFANRTTKKAKKLAKDLNGEYGTNKDAAKCEFVFICVKPDQAEKVLNEIKDTLSTSTILVSTMAGWTIEKIQSIVKNPVIRIMPNTPARIGEGMTLYAMSEGINKKDLAYFFILLKDTGRVTKIEERLIDAASAITGCGPAFADIFVDALADGAVAMGVPRAEAIEFAAQMMVGTGKLILESGKHPDELKDEVCSPSGSTIQGVIALEKGGFRASVINAVVASCEKNKKLG